MPEFPSGIERDAAPQGPPDISAERPETQDFGERWEAEWGRHWEEAEKGPSLRELAQDDGQDWRSELPEYVPPESERTLELPSSEEQAEREREDTRRRLHNIGIGVPSRPQARLPPYAPPKQWETEWKQHWEEAEKAPSVQQLKASVPEDGEGQGRIDTIFGPLPASEVGPIEAPSEPKSQGAHETHQWAPEQGEDFGRLEPAGGSEGGNGAVERLDDLAEKMGQLVELQRATNGLLEELKQAAPTWGTVS